jgi:hypothetical protein
MYKPVTLNKKFEIFGQIITEVSMKIGRLISSLAILIAVLAFSEPAHLAADGCDSDCCSELSFEPRVCSWGYNLPAHRECNDSSYLKFTENLSGHIDFLWWRPCAEGLELGTEIKPVDFKTSSLHQTTVDTHVQDLNFKFDPGFKLGIDYFSQCSCWDLSIDWTHFHSKAKAFGSGIGTLSDSPQLIFVSSWDFGLKDPIILEEARSRWTLDMDLVDLEIAKSFYIDQCLILRPFVGLRIGRIDQGYHVEGFGADDLGEPGTTKVKASCDFLGVGPRLGFDVDFKLGCGFSLFGEAAGSLVFGRFHRGSKEFSEVIQESGEVRDLIYNAHGGSASRCTMTMTDIAIGLMWEHCFRCCNRSHPFALIFAWEQHAFYDINRFNFASNGLAVISEFVTSPETKEGDLTTQGLTISAIIGF